MIDPYNPSLCPTCGRDLTEDDVLEPCSICSVSGCDDCIGDWRGQAIHNLDCE